jgi:hypothetical protein
VSRRRLLMRLLRSRLKLGKSQRSSSVSFPAVFVFATLLFCCVGFDVGLPAAFSQYFRQQLTAGLSKSARIKIANCERLRQSNDRSSIRFSSMLICISPTLSNPNCRVSFASLATMTAAERLPGAAACNF